jgi:hypothetical protein|tara:strand:+ start:1103 stop:1399 length:297 start_codon:yes stop_codon:yes gene_type:complete
MSRRRGDIWSWETEDLIVKSSDAQIDELFERTNLLWYWAFTIVLFLIGVIIDNVLIIVLYGFLQTITFTLWFLRSTKGHPKYSWSVLFFVLLIIITEI